MGKSSKDKRDAYYRLAKEQGWRARSAYKLLQLDEEFDLFADVTRVVDLCAAPGSWSQVLSRVLIKGEKFGRSAWEDKEEKLRQQLLQVHGGASTSSPSAPAQTSEEGEDGDSADAPKLKPRRDVKIVAIDLQPMSPLEGITTLRADITHPATVPLLLNVLDPAPTPASSQPEHQNATTPTITTSHRVDLVLSDGAPDVTGLHDLDIYVQSQLLFAALNLTLRILRPGGKFVAKIFRGRNVDLLFAQLKIFFGTVVVAKPRASRASSVEAFIVCLDFKGAGNHGALGELGGGLSAAGVENEGELNQVPSLDPAAAAVDIITAPSTSKISPPSSTQPQTDPFTSPGIFELNVPDLETEARLQGRWIPPFLACGDLSSFDADASYHLPKDRVSLDPIQPPTAPPYKRALEMRRVAGGAGVKTTGPDL